MKTQLAHVFTAALTLAATQAVLAQDSRLHHQGQNLYATCVLSDSIVEITPDGVQSVFYSSSGAGVNGLAFNSAGDLFVAQLGFFPYPGGHYITEITPHGTQSTFASGLNYPIRITFDTASNLFEADYDSGTIKKITPDGIESTFASGLSGPSCLAFNSAGDLFVGDVGSGNIYEFTPEGMRSTFASGLYVPNGLAFDRAGNLYVGADDDKVYKFTPAGAKTIFASGIGFVAGLVFDSDGNLYAGDRSEHNAIYKITPDGVMSIFASGLDLDGVFDLAFQPGRERQEKSTYDNSTPITGDWVTFGSGSAIVDGAETTATYGQTFTAPPVGSSDSRTHLNEWTFYLQQVPAELGGIGTVQNFEFFVMAWDATNGRATGPILYHSSPQTVAADVTSYTPFTVHPDLDLTPGSQYVVLINVSLRRNDNNPLGSSLELAGNGSGGLFPWPASSSPLGGQFVYQYTAGEFDSIDELDTALTTQPWATWAVNEFTSYHAVFSDEESRHNR